MIAIDVARSGMRHAVRWRTAQLLDPAIFYALLVLIVLVAIPYGSVHPWWEAVFECIVFALTASWIIDGLLSGTWKVSGHRLVLPLLALLAFALVQTIPWDGQTGTAWINGETWWPKSADLYETRRFALKLLALILAGMLLLRYTSDQRRLRSLIHVIVGVGVASALFGIMRQMAQGDAPTFGSLPLSPDQSYGQFIDRNHFAFLMEMVLGLVLGLMVSGRLTGSRRLIYLAAAVLLWSALVLSTSRGGIFSMLCQLVFLALLFGVPQPTEAIGDSSDGSPGWLRRVSSLLVVRMVFIACLLVAVIVGIVWMGGDPLIQRLGTVSREFSANDDDKRMNTRRVEIWGATWRLIKDHPITGTGFGAYWIAFPRYHDASGVFTQEESQYRPLAAHNDYLELLASGGLIGGLLGAWFVIVFIRCALERFRRCRDPFRRAARLGALVGLFGVAVHSLLDFGLHDTINALVFTALVVIAIVEARMQGKILRESDV